ncbi:hypothetical protein [Bradyrhizobium sp. McL0616]|uniref:hypothetical protein n=1 Tax=Bradyrhizobium sp. McL0616 TaxID=3415674 RepID=UPI003CF3C319
MVEAEFLGRLRSPEECTLAYELCLQRYDFKSWRDKYANTPRKTDLAWTVLARILSFAKDRGIVTSNPSERGGRLYVADRRDKI